MHLIPISHYGLHTDENVAYLHQGKASAANFIGLRKTSPFQNRPDGAKACPHLMNVASPNPDRVHMAEFIKLYPDDLFQAMLPIPKEKFGQVPFFNDPNNDLSMILTILGKLSSPLVPVVYPYRSLSERMILQKLSLTNVCPLVLTGVETEDQSSLNKLVTEAQLLPRQLVVVGDPMIVVRPPMIRKVTNLRCYDVQELVRLPMEQLGVMALRRFVRGEKIEAPYVQRGEDEMSEA